MCSRKTVGRAGDPGGVGMQGPPRFERAAHPCPAGVQGGGQLKTPACTLDPSLTGGQSCRPPEETLPQSHPCPCSHTRQSWLPLGMAKNLLSPRPCTDTRKASYVSGTHMKQVCCCGGRAEYQHPRPTTDTSRMQPPQGKLRKLLTLH